MSKQDEIGTLIIVVLKARNLLDKHKFRKQDAYAKLTLNGDDKQTKVEIKGGQHPLWDEEFRFPILKNTAKKYRTLEVSCWAKESRSDDCLGTGSIDITETLQTGEFDDWVPISIEGVARGDLYLEMTYYANGPPPQAPIAPVNFPSVIPAGRPSTSVPNPAPVKAALGIPQTNLVRRPSKLPPGDRLSRPSYTGYAPPQNRTSPPSHKYSALPPIPDEWNPTPTQPPPSLLRPGAVPRPLSHPDIPSTPHTRPHSNSNAAETNPYLVARPSTITANQRPTTAPSTSPVHTNPYLAGPAPPTIVYDRPVHSPQPPAPQAPYGQPPQHSPSRTYTAVPPSRTPVPDQPPLLWAPSGAPEPSIGPGGFAFPMPNAYNTPPQQSPSPPFGGHIAAPAHPYHHHRRASDPRDDLALRDRYQTPLPLPPGSKPPPTPAPPKPAPSPPRREHAASLGHSLSSDSYSSRHTSRTPSPPRPPPPPSLSSNSYSSSNSPRAPSSPDRRRLEELRRIEEDAAKRRKQELTDLELALQLDKELNL